MCINIMHSKEGGFLNPLFACVIVTVQLRVIRKIVMEKVGAEKVKDKEKRLGVCKDIAIVGLPLAIFLFWILTTWKINYQVHDDRYMMEFLSGKFLASSDAHLVYIKYPFAILMQGMYQLFPGHDWYAAVMLSLQIAMIAIMTWYIVRNIKEIKYKVFSQIAFYSFFILCWINEITCFTYTTVAALVGATIVVVYALGQDRIRDYVMLLLLCFLVFNLRSDLFFMILPVCGILWIRKSFHNKFKQQMVFGLILLIVVGGSWICNAVAYSSEPWKEYMKYNSARTKVYDYDYDDLIVYETNREMYDKLNISEDECKILESYDLSLCDETLYGKIPEVADAYTDHKTFGIKIQNTMKAILSDGLLESKMMTLVSVLLWGILILATVWSRKKDVIWMEIGFALVHIVLWLYLGYKGRILPRVSHSMLLLQIVTPCICLYYTFCNVVEKKWNKMVKRLGSIGLLIVLLGVCAYDVLLCNKLMHKNEKEAGYRDQYIIEQYCNSHKDNFYFLDVFSVVECKYTFDYDNKNEYENFVSLGDWFGNSPIYKKKLQIENIDSVRQAVLENENVYVIGIVGKDLGFISGITDKDVTIESVDFLDGGMDDYVVYQVKSM